MMRTASLWWYHPNIYQAQCELGERRICWLVQSIR